MDHSVLKLSYSQIYFSIWYFLWRYFSISNFIALVNKKNKNSSSHNYLITALKKTCNETQFFLLMVILACMVECLLMVQWVIGLIPHGGFIGLFLVPASTKAVVCTMLSVGWCRQKDPLLLIGERNQWKGGRQYVSILLSDPFPSFIMIPASAPRLVQQRSWYELSWHDMVYIKEPLLLIGKSSACSGGNGFSFSLSEWSVTICLPYNQK